MQRFLSHSDVGDVVYADVKVWIGKKKQDTNHFAETVEYGQIRLNHQPDE